MLNLFFYETPIGRLGIGASEIAVTHLYFHESESIGWDWNLEENEVLEKAGRQLLEYFDGSLTEFNIPLDPAGTPFMCRVWQALIEIPYGHTESYKEVAQKIGKPKAARAVGLANNRNPIPIFIPCHRVIGSNSRLVGYRGGITTKLHLLELEKKILQNN